MATDSDTDDAGKLHLVHKSKNLEVHYFEDTLAIVNGWYFIDFLGEGSFGDVYLLEDEKQDNQIAVKVVDKSNHVSIKNEIAALRSIDSAAVVKLLDVFESPTHHEVFLALQYIHGGALGMVDQCGELTTPVITGRRLRLITRQCCEALAAVHEAGIIHQDIKPENFVLEQMKDRVVLIDFGSAWKLDREKCPTNLTDSLNDRPNEVETVAAADDSARRTIGTPLFLAPEAMLESRRGFPAVSLDLWALGVTVFTIAIGYVPFGRGCTTEATLYATAPRQELRFPENEQIPEKLRAFIAGTLSKEVTKRMALPEMLDHPFLTQGDVGLCSDKHESFTAAPSSIGESQKSNTDQLRQVMRNPGLITYKSFRRDVGGSLHGAAANKKAVQTMHISFAKPGTNTVHSAAGIAHLQSISPELVGGSQNLSHLGMHCDSKGASDRMYIYNTSILRVGDEKLVTRVMICEHHLHVLNTLKKIIKAIVQPHVSLRVDTCRTGKEAVALAQRFKYKLIILSARLLDKPGLTVAQEIRRNERCSLVGTVPILGVGTLDDTATREMAMQSGCFQGLVKHPIPVRELLDLLKWRGIKVRELQEVNQDLASEVTKNTSKYNQYFVDYLKNQECDESA